MKHRIDEKLLEEANTFSFRFACDDCAHFDVEVCSLGYPPAPRRRLVLFEELEFCKEFDLGGV